MFINILDYGVSNRKVQKHFQYFRSSVSLCFQEMLAAMLILHIKYIH